MSPADKAEFVTLLTRCYTSVQRALPSFDALDLWFAALQPFTLAQVRDALAAHMREHHFPPQPGDVVSRISAHDGRLEADEAWAIAITARDEHETVVWTDETADAWHAVRDLYATADVTGARFAFRAAYTRMCEENRAQGVPVHWQVSPGFDVARREQVIDEAIRMGRLRIEQGRTHVPALAAPDDGEGDGPAVDVAANRAALRDLVQAIRDKQAQRVAEHEQRLGGAAAATLARKRELAAQAETLARVRGKS